MSKITRLKALVTKSRMTKLGAKTKKWSQKVKKSLRNMGQAIKRGPGGRGWKKIGAFAAIGGIGYGAWWALSKEDKDTLPSLAYNPSDDEIERIRIESEGAVRDAIGLIRSGCDTYLSHSYEGGGIPDSLLDDMRKEGLLKIILGMAMIERNETKDVSDFIEKARISVPSVGECGFMFEGVLDGRVGVNTIEEIVGDDDCAERRLYELQFTLANLGLVSSLKQL